MVAQDDKEPTPVRGLTSTQVKEELYRLLHVCWGQSTASPDYDKAMWRRLAEVVDRVRYSKGDV